MDTGAKIGGIVARNRDGRAENAVGWLRYRPSIRLWPSTSEAEMEGRVGGRKYQDI